MNNPESSQICMDAELCYYDYLYNREEDDLVPASIAAHIEQCDNCQEQLRHLESTLSEGSALRLERRQQRSTIIVTLALHMGYIDKPVTCRTVRPFLFSLADSNVDLKVSTPITAHLDECQQCRENLETIRKLNLTSEQLEQIRVIYEARLTREATASSQIDTEIPTSDDISTVLKMLDGPESGIITTYNIDKSSENTPKRKLSWIRRKIVPGTGLAATFFILAAIYFIDKPVAKEATIAQIYEAFEGARNISVVAFAQDLTSPVKEELVSRTPGIYMIKDQDGATFWNVRDKTKKSRLVNNQKWTRFDNLTFGKIEKKIAGTLDLFPFPKTEKIPENAHWIPTTEPNVEVSFKDAEVYELQWSEKQPDRSVISKKWRVFIEAGTNLPLKVEFYSKPSVEGDYSLESQIMVEYPSDSQIKSILKEYSF